MRATSNPERSSDAVALQRVAQAVGLAARVHEDHRAGRVAIAQQREQQRDFFFVRREVDALRDSVDRHLVGLDADELGIVHVLVRELEHAVRQSCGEQHVQTMAALGQTPQHEADVFDETEIEHPIRLVEHEHLYAAQTEHALLEEVDGSSRRADQNVDAGRELFPLLVVVRAAERESELVWQVAAEHLRVRVNLHRELAGRREDQRARTGLALRRLRRLETIEQCD